jgi:hypothetical protein
MKTLPPLIIPINVQKEIMNFLKFNLSGGNDGKCFFRRFSRLMSTTEPYKITENIDPDTSIILNNLNDITPTQMDRYVEINYKSFFGCTSGRYVRDDEPECVKNTEIFLHSNSYSQVDLTLNYTFDFSNDKRLCSAITPFQDDLILIFMTNEKLEYIKSKKPSVRPPADKWCIVSEQCLHAYTAIFNDWHETFDNFVGPNVSNEERESVLKSKLFSGNRLMTNSWLKYKLATLSNDIPFTQNVSREKYWHLRTEYASRRWVDVYTALILVARYGELPCPCNIPDYRKPSDVKIKEIHRLQWNLPPNFITMLIQRACRVEILSPDCISNYAVWSPFTKSKEFYSKSKVEKGFLDEIAAVKFINTVDSAIETMGPIIKNTGCSVTMKIEASPTNKTWAKIAKSAIEPVHIEPKTLIPIEEAIVKESNNCFTVEVKVNFPSQWINMIDETNSSED